MYMVGVMLWASLPRKSTLKAPLDERRFLSPAFTSLYERRAEVVTTHAPSTPEACEAHTQPVERSLLPVQLFGSADTVFGPLFAANGRCAHLLPQPFALKVSRTPQGFLAGLLVTFRPLMVATSNKHRPGP
jgi:hypothetical protein